MIVRVSGEGQFRLPDGDAERLNELDNRAVAAAEQGDETGFHELWSQMLELVASDTVANVLFVSPRQQCVYHPYDGGGDVLLPSPTARDAMRARYTEWLPGNPAGL